MGGNIVVLLVLIVVSQRYTDGCSKKEPIVYKDAECTEGAIEDKSLVRNGTFGPDEYCNQCYCIKGKWKCEIKKCGCYPGQVVHIWQDGIRIGCFCTMEGILDKSDCTSEWFIIKKGRSVPDRFKYGYDQKQEEKDKLE